MKAKNNKYKEAVRKIFTHCLELPGDVEITIFYDETTKDVASIFSEVSQEFDLLPAVFYVNTDLQRYLVGEVLPKHYSSAIENSIAILNCLTSSKSCYQFRNLIRLTGQSFNCQVAHMPGIDIDTLLLANVDYDELIKTSEQIATALAMGGEIEILTYSKLLDQNCKLTIPNDPWTRLPIISDGIIPAGAWGNVPSGETYLAPIEGEAHGEISINGSIPGMKLENEEIVLFFENGRLSKWLPEKGKAIDHLIETRINWAKERKDPNWSVLAEVGFGTNKKVMDLTGNMLFDEKKYGTLHIALGDNHDMGGETKSEIHCDMVVENPIVLIGGKQIIKDGKIKINEKDWLTDYKNIKIPQNLNLKSLFRCNGRETHTNTDGVLSRVWTADSGKKCSIQIGSNETAIAAGRLFSVIKGCNALLSLEKVFFIHPDLENEDTLKLIYFLSLYDLISFEEEIN